ncbi:MAG: hypothetical protein KJO07_04370 [Deltaproteobacteria bacterium]|nr:hypothetical protein [Deltaproteobacteria bacterium]
MSESVINGWRILSRRARQFPVGKWMTWLLMAAGLSLCVAAPRVAVPESPSRAIDHGRFTAVLGDQPMPKTTVEVAQLSEAGTRPGS